MMLRGIAVAAILIAGAALNIQYSNGAAAVVSPHDESLDIVTQAGTPVANVDASVDADAMAPPRMAQAPISLGNPATAAALDALTSDRTTANTTQIAMATPNADVTDTTAVTTEPTTYQLAVKIKSGDTLSNALRRVGANPVDAEAAIRALKGQYDPRDLRAGQTIHVNFAPSGQASGKDLFTGFEIPLITPRALPWRPHRTVATAPMKSSAIWRPNMCAPKAPSIGACSKPDRTPVFRPP